MFQAPRHTCADLVTGLHGANLVTAEVGATARPGADQALAARYLAGSAVQLHDGMGHTWETPVHLGLRRIMRLSGLGPSTADRARRVGRNLVEHGVTSALL